MNIPTIGGTRGVFEIFVPGAFLLLNLAAVVYLLPFIDEDTKSFISGCGSTPALGLVIILCFGYLIGVILRLFGVEPVDKLSAKWIQMTKTRAQQEDGVFKLWARERFPYIGWIGEVCKSDLPPNTVEFYYNTWASRRREGRNTHFFNFCKTIINSVDERAANEIYAAEALSRYISGTFYSLVIASCLLLVTAVLNHGSLGIMIPLLLIVVVYVLAISAILNFFRFIRIKEVEIVFAATFRHRSIFYGKLATSGNTV